MLTAALEALNFDSPGANPGGGTNISTLVRFTMRIENWFVTRLGDMYTSPEMSSMLIHGEVYGNPKFIDGTYINTSRVITVEGNKITTRSGSVYELGIPNPEYVQWCKENNLHIPTVEEPIRVVNE